MCMTDFLRLLWDFSTRRLQSSFMKFVLFAGVQRGNCLKMPLLRRETEAMDHMGLEDQNCVINEDCKRFPSKFVWQELSDQLCNYWMQESFQTKFVVGKKNRSENIKKYCTGSVGISVHAHRMSEQLQRPVSDDEVYRAITKAGEFVDDYSRDLLISTVLY